MYDAVAIGHSPPGRSLREHEQRQRGAGPIVTKTASAIAMGVLLALSGAEPTRAATSFSPFATVGVQDNSNVFMRPSGQPPFAASGISALGDTITQYQAGADAELDFGPDRLTLTGDGERDIYDRFALLDHTDYNLLASLDWHLGPLLDGTASYQQSRYLALFTQTLSTQLLLDEQRTATATGRLRVSDEWRIDLTPSLNQQTTPLPGFPDFRLDETTGAAELDYLGFGPLTAGVEYEYDTGHYSGIVAATRYDQRDVDLTANYKVSGLSSFNASAGYSRRDTQADLADSVTVPAGGTVFGGYAGVLGTTSAATGALSYHRQLTGKTGATLSLYRSVSSYTAAATPEISTGGTLGVNWKADPKFTVDLSYGLARDRIQGQLVVVDVTNRSDRTQTATLDVRYAALSWLTVRPYFDWTKATSTLTLANYSQSIVGIEVTTRLKW